MRQVAPGGKAWSLLSSHGLVLFFLATHPNATLRDLSGEIGLTERTIHTVITDLVAVGMVHVQRVGRQNIYEVNPEAHFVHPLFAHLRVEAFLAALNGRSGC